MFERLLIVFPRIMIGKLDTYDFDLKSQRFIDGYLSYRKHGRKIDTLISGSSDMHLLW